MCQARLSGVLATQRFETHSPWVAVFRMGLETWLHNEPAVALEADQRGPILLLAR